MRVRVRKRRGSRNEEEEDKEGDNYKGNGFMMKNITQTCKRLVDSKVCKS